MRLLIFSIFFLILSACIENETNQNGIDESSCRGEFVEMNEAGLTTKKYIEKFQNGLGCVTEPVPLSSWEKSSLKRYNDKVECTPQSDFSDVWLISANNYYEPRNGSMYLELKASTGEFRKLVVYSSKSGGKVFFRESGCFYSRIDLEIEPVNPTDYGSQLLLDNELAASSLDVSPMEVYRYQRSGGNWEMIRFDSNEIVDWTFCSTATPVGYCDERRNGNIYYEPDDPSEAIKDKLKATALLLRSEFNWVEISEAQFQSKWNNAIANHVERGTWEYIEGNHAFKYFLLSIVDVPIFIHRTWRDYLMGRTPYMPDTSSVKLPEICYPAEREVIYVDGSVGTIFGEACYEDGAYTFN